MIRWYTGSIAKLTRASQLAMEQTAEAVRTDLRNSQTLPRDTGQLTEQTFVDRSKSAQGTVSVVSNTPYARRLYYHPEYQFRRDKNRFAGGLWFRPYMSKGTKKNFVKETFEKRLKAIRG